MTMRGIEEAVEFRGDGSSLPLGFPERQSSHDGRQPEVRCLPRERTGLQEPADARILRTCRIARKHLFGVIYLRLGELGLMLVD